ncbi:MAG TPA: Dyp-type peroxidase [Acidimicrobiales bacterium]|jgi:putative iron-dependent peroxidase|nr:Dyp-type peroxidase [Acidimicrobiales bacterium]
MPRHQYGIFAEGTRAQHHLELQLRDGATPAAVGDALLGARLANAQHRTNGGTNLVIGFGPKLWSLFPDALPTVAVPAFPGYDNVEAGLHAPATQQDLWVWVHGPETDLVIDVVRAAAKALDPVATLTLDLPAFVYHDSRDLTGFIDGTANPFLDDAPVEAVVADDQPGAGGTYAMTMRFVHDLTAFEALPVAEQELVFGRTKDASEELPPETKPADSHIGRAEVEDDEGEELVVYRRSVPWATAAQQGLHFVAFGADTDRFDLQLRTMYGLADDDLTDRLLQFTTPITGSFWFCPSVEALEAIAPLPDDED